MRTSQSLACLGAVAAPIGAVVFIVSTLLHPSASAPSDFPAALAEYAASSHWVGIHLGQFVGVAAEGMALVALAATFEPGRATAWARIGLAGTVASVAVYAAVQAVDGVANHVMAHRWAVAGGEARVLGYEAAFAVRQIEVGLTSLFGLVFGSTLIVFGLAMLLSIRYPAWLGGTGLLGGLGTLAIGLEQAFNGFSDLALTLFMVVGPIDLIYANVTGILLLRLVPQLTGDT